MFIILALNTHVSQQWHCLYTCASAHFFSLLQRHWMCRSLLHLWTQKAEHRRHWSSLYEVHFFFFLSSLLKIPQSALEKLGYFMPETLMPLQTCVRIPSGPPSLVFTWSVPNPRDLYHPESFTSSFCVILQDSFHLQSSDGAKRNSMECLKTTLCCLWNAHHIATTLQWNSGLFILEPKFRSLYPLSGSCVPILTWRGWPGMGALL